MASSLREELLRIGNFLERYVSDPLVEVNSSNINEILESYRVVVLFFTAEWCGPCITLQNALRDIASRVLRDDVIFGRVDVDRSYAVAERFEVKHIPGILVLVNRRVEDVIVGSTTREKLEERLKKYVS